MKKGAADIVGNLIVAHLHVIMRMADTFNLNSSQVDDK